MGGLFYYKMQIKQIDKVVEETEGRDRILKGWQ